MRPGNPDDFRVCPPSPPSTSAGTTQADKGGVPMNRQQAAKGSFKPEDVTPQGKSNQVEFLNSDLMRSIEVDKLKENNIWL